MTTTVNNCRQCIWVTERKDTKLAKTRINCILGKKPHLPFTTLLYYWERQKEYAACDLCEQGSHIILTDGRMTEYPVDKVRAFLRITGRTPWESINGT